MTHEELQAIKARAEAATPGPWIWPDNGGMHSEPAWLAYRRWIESDHDNMEMGTHADAIITTDSGYYGPNEADKAFIAHARTDVPALVAEVERLRALLRATNQIGEVSRTVGPGEVRIVITAEAEADIIEGERREMLNEIAGALVTCSMKQQMRTMT